MVVKTDTVVRWHRKGFKLFWRHKSRRKGPGRPPISRDVRNLIRRMAEARNVIAPMMGVDSSLRIFSES